MSIRVAEIRKAAWHYLTPEVASAVGLTLGELQGFAAGSFHPTAEQIARLANRMGINR